METILESKPRFCFEFEVEKVIGVSSDGNYQVQWAPAWVSKFHLVGCEHLIQEFLQKQNEEVQLEPEKLAQGQDESVEMGTKDSQENEFPSQRTEMRLQFKPENHFKEPELSGEMGASQSYSEIAHQASIEQTASHQLTVKIEASEEDTLLETGRFVTSTDLPFPLDSSASTMNDALTSTNVVVGYYQGNESPETVGRTSSIDAILNQSQYSGPEEDGNEKSPHQTHLITHRSEKTFQCSQCEKKFTHGSALSRHARGHKEKRSYACILCKKKFNRKDNLMRHVRGHSGK